MPSFDLKHLDSSLDIFLFAFIGIVLTSKVYSYITHVVSDLLSRVALQFIFLNLTRNIESQISIYTFSEH